MLDELTATLANALAALDATLAEAEASAPPTPFQLCRGEWVNALGPFLSGVRTDMLAPDANRRRLGAERLERLRAAGGAARRGPHATPDTTNR